MPKQFGSQIDLQKIPVIGLVAEQKSTAPAAPVNGQLWYDTTANVTKCYDNGAWVLIGNTAGGSTPSGPAGGDLTGSTYPNPVIAANAVTTAKILDEAVDTFKIKNNTIVSTDLALASVRLDSIGLPTAPVQLNGQKLTGVADPTAAQDAATKAYVDATAQGLDIHASVKYATTTAIASASYNATGGTGGRGLITVPTGVDLTPEAAVSVGDRVLVKNQAAPAQNGIYVVAGGGTTLDRASDADADAELTAGAFVFVEAGATLSDTGWVLTTNNPITVGGASGSSLTWAQFSGAGTYTNGAGLSLTGNVFSVSVGGIDSNMIANGSVADVDVNAANKDGTAGTPSMRTLGTGSTQAAAGNDARLTDSRTPSGAAGGDLTGTYPNPTIGTGKVTTTHILDGTIVDADVNVSNKDGSAAVPSMRTLGTGAAQAASGADSRFTDARAPSGAAGGDLAGSTYPNPVIAASAVTSAKILDGTIVHGDVAAANKDGLNAVPSMRTLGFGVAQAMQGSTTLDFIPLAINSVDMNNQLVRNVLAPSLGTDAANKAYVDTLTQGLDAKGSVRLATAGVQLSAGAPPNGGATIDGFAVVTGDRILVKDQSSAQNNGIWIANTAGAWTRATDMDAWTEVPAAYTWVEIGTSNADTGWVCTADQGGTLNTTAITWTQFTGAGQITAGAGMTKTGNTLDVVAKSDGGLTANADDIAIKLLASGGLGTIAGGAYVALQIPSPGLVIDGTGVGVLCAAGGGITKNINGLLIDTTVVTRKFAGSCPAFTAGVEANVVHNLGTKDVVVSFRNTSDFEVVLQWRAIDVNTIGVTADVAYGAAALRAVVMG